MNHQAKIKGINNCLVRSESAIMAGNRLAVLPFMQDYVADKKKLLFSGSLDEQYGSQEPDDHSSWQED